MKHVSVVGLGYVGLPTAIIAAEAGYMVSGFDIDPSKVAAINSGTPDMVEPDVGKRLRDVLSQKTFQAYDTLQQADFFIVAVPTPLNEDNTSDLTSLWRAGALLAPVLKQHDTIIIESTVPVGTTDTFSSVVAVQSGLKEHNDFFVAYCPERVLPGKIFDELVGNDRVIGGANAQASRRAQDFYAAFVRGELFCVETKTAEMVKLVENSSRDVQIAFANQIASMCEAVGLNPFEIIRLANKHPRVSILRPGCGVGGHCIPIDPWFLIERFPRFSSLLTAAREINDARSPAVVEKVEKAVLRWQNARRTSSKPRVVLLGLSYKSDSDDLRGSPALSIAHALAEKTNRLKLYVCDPHVSPSWMKQKGFKRIITVQDIVSVADIAVILVSHKAFECIDIHELKKKVVIDTCGFLSPDAELEVAMKNLVPPKEHQQEV